ncbi:HYR domain-containing protein [Mariprofundus ferrooxydans]|nr:HYR domain-containing protein [Mariprofundus ferrooxydans]
MLRFLSVSILLSFLLATPVLAADSDEGFISKSWHSITSYFTDEKAKEKHGGGDSHDEEVDRDDDVPVTPTPTPVADTVPPSIKIQQTAITVEATALQMAVNLGVVTAVDLVDGNVPVSNNAPATFSLGVTTVTWTATDAAGNAATAQQQATVQDTVSPVIAAPLAVTANSTTGQPIAVTIGVATATDIFPLTISNNAPAVFPIGNTTVIWTATDANGNSMTANQLVTVLVLDVTPPVVVAPAAITTEANALQTVVVLGAATASDNIDPYVQVLNDAPAAFSLGVTTVTYTATDAAGNVGTATQAVTVQDTTPPQITPSLDVLLVSPDGLGVASLLSPAIATDIFPVSISNNAPAVFPVGVTAVLWTATDANGNSSTATQLVTVEYTAPALSAAAVAAIPAGSFGATYRSLVPADASIAAYNPDRFSMITGLVRDLNGLPIAGVKVMVHKHPEYGSSMTDVTGRYSLPVDGGALFTVDITSPNYLMLQRQVKTAWNQIYTVETVALIAQDNKATTITFDGNPATKIVHSSTPFTDVDGTRATHLVFSGNTTHLSNMRMVLLPH